jgi:hypothetical protein
VSEIVIAPTTSADSVHHSYVDWAAVFAGTVLASAISFIMTTFGSGIGLSLTSPFRGEGVSSKVFAIVIAIWVVWVAVSSFVAGGYLTGRMRRRFHDATEHESDIRDGAHGLIVWALGVLITTYLASSSIQSVGKVGAEVAGSGVFAAISAVTQSIGTKPDSIGYEVDTLLRSESSTPPSGDGERQEISSIVSMSLLNGALSPADKAYLTKVVAARSGVSPAEAATRVDALGVKLNAMAEKAKEVADTARKVGILISFITAASLAVAAAGAWFGAQTGGRHRDEGTDLSHLTRRW